MALPTLMEPTFEVENPETNEKITCRPMTVKEEKILLMAKTTDNRYDQWKATKQIVQNCIVDKKVNVDDLPFFVMEYLFIKIREQSISNIAKAVYLDPDEEEQRTFDVNLGDIELKKDDGINNTIDLGDNISLILKYPSVKINTSKEFHDLKEEEIFDYIMANCVDKIFEGDTMHDTKMMSKGELQKFIDSIPARHYVKIKEFFDKIPYLHYSIKYTNNNGVKRTIDLNGIDDFFIFV